MVSALGVKEAIDITYIIRLSVFGAYLVRFCTGIVNVTWIIKKWIYLLGDLIVCDSISYERSSIYYPFS